MKSASCLNIGRSHERVGSTDLKLAYSAGTKQPLKAMTVRRPIWRKYVLLPDMLYDEIRRACRCMSRESLLGSLHDLERSRVAAVHVVRDERPSRLHVLQNWMTPSFDGERPRELWSHCGQRWSL